MNEPSVSAMTTYFGWVIVSVLQGLHPGAACGAAFGCFFFLSFPDPDKRPVLRKTALLAFSWGWGYSVGDAVSKTEHWANWTMVSAVTAAAMAATVFGVINLMVANNGPVPFWVEWIVDRVPFLKSRNTDEPK
ncbi:MAG: putative holin [Pseudomonas sp.]